MKLFLICLSSRPENYSDQAHNCPRDWRLSASWGPMQGTFKLLEHHSTMVSILEGFEGVALQHCGIYLGGRGCHHSTMVSILGGFEGPISGPSLCREAPVPRTDDVNISSMVRVGLYILYIYKYIYIVY